MVKEEGGESRRQGGGTEGGGEGKRGGDWTGLTVLWMTFKSVGVSSAAVHTLILFTTGLVAVPGGRRQL